MGAMLVGMATGIPMMMLVVFCIIVQAVVIAFCAYKNQMSVKWWLFSSLVLASWALIPFIFSIIKIRTARCKSCSARVKRKTKFCPHCGESFKTFDDESFIRKIMIAIAVVIAALEVVTIILSAAGVQIA